jgi:hypothetical protein
MMKNFIISCFILSAVVTLLSAVEARKPAKKCLSYGYRSTCTRYGYKCRNIRVCIRMGKCSSWKVRSSGYRCKTYINANNRYRQCVLYVPHVNNFYCAARYRCYRYGSKRQCTYGCRTYKRTRICRRLQIYS